MLGGKRLRATIVITSYNRPRQLRLAYKGARGQSWENTQIIIADDNSSDPKVLEYLESLEDTPNLTIFRSNVTDEDRGKTARYATQINDAVRLFADGEYLLFLPDDDWFMHKKVETHVKAMSENGWDVSYSSQAIMKREPRLQQHGERFANKVLTDAYNIVDHGQVCVTRKAFDAVGGWPDDPQYWSGADAYFWRRLTDAGYLFHPIAEVLCMKVENDGVQNKVFTGRKPWEERKTTWQMK